MNPHDLRWETTEEPLPAATRVIDEGLDHFNRQAADLGAVRQFACFARLNSGDVLGGALARRWGKCCELLQMWVAEGHRSQGIGRHLVGRIEKHARNHGCDLLYLETFSFQAPEFYRALGYEVVCEFAGFPDGISKVTMRKELVA